jgi:hypothetical protein
MNDMEELDYMLNGSRELAEYASSIVEHQAHLEAWCIGFVSMEQERTTSK